jgi:hypothetical protein
MKTRTAVLSLMSIFLSTILVVSCKHEPFPVFAPASGGGTGGPGNGGGTTPPSTGICFESQVLPLFQSNCAKSGCHDAASGAEGYVLIDYTSITKRGISPGNPNSSKLYTVLSRSMPPRGYTALTAQQQGIIAQWITEGAKNTTNCNSGSCDTTKFAYGANIKPLMQTYCNGCHSGTTPSGNIDLGSYSPTSVVAKNGKLYGSVAHLSGFIAMPQGAAQLSACELRIIKKWVDAGAPNN